MGEREAERERETERERGGERERDGYRERERERERGQEGPVNAVAVCHVDEKQQRMVTVSEDSYIRLWDVETI